MFNSWSRRLTQFVLHTLALVGVLAFSAACYAQTCALCYTQAASSGSRIIQGLRSGILVLVVPPMFMSIGITVLAYKKRNKFSRTSASRDHADGGW